MRMSMASWTPTREIIHTSSFRRKTSHSQFMWISHQSFGNRPQCVISFGRSRVHHDILFRWSIVKHHDPTPRCFAHTQTTQRE